MYSGLSTLEPTIGNEAARGVLMYSQFIHKSRKRPHLVHFFAPLNPSQMHASKEKTLIKVAQQAGESEKIAPLVDQCVDRRFSKRKEYN